MRGDVGGVDLGGIRLQVHAPTCVLLAARVRRAEDFGYPRATMPMIQSRVKHSQRTVVRMARSSSEIRLTGLRLRPYGKTRGGGVVGGGGKDGGGRSCTQGNQEPQNGVVS